MPISRRALLGSGAASTLLAACDRSPLEVGEMAIQKSIIPIKFTGLDTSKDPKTGAAGRVQLLENAWASRDTDGGIELRKWPGTAALSRSIDGGGTISAGGRVASLRDTLTMTDGTFLYQWGGSSLNKWIKKGRIPEVASVRSDVSASIGIDPLTVDMAVSGGFAVFVARPFGGDLTYYVQDLATNTVIVRSSITTAIKPRVVSVGTDFFIFYHDGTNTLYCQKISTSTPDAIGAATAVATNANATCHFDVTVDSTNSRMVLIYRNTTPTTTLAIWNTNMTAGTAVAYATRDPDLSVGLLYHDFADGHGYAAICTSATGVRVLTFGAGSMTVTTDTLVDGAVTTSQRVTGYFTANRNVFYEVPGSTTGATTRVSGWQEGTSFNVRRSVGLGSKVFKVGTKYYFVGVYSSDTQGHLYLFEFDSDFTGTRGTISLAGHLLDGDCAGPRIPDLTGMSSCLGHAAVISAGSQLAFAYPRVLGARPPVGSSDTDSPYAICRFDLTWGAASIGSPVVFDGALHFPGACPKVFDGEACTELGFAHLPEPVNGATQSITGGGMTALGRYGICVVYQAYDNTGRLLLSGVSPAVFTTLTGANDTITVNVPTLRITERATAENLVTVAGVSLSLYVTSAGGTTFHKRSVFDNSTTVDSFSVVVTGTDTLILSGEDLYTDTGEVDSVSPPSVIAYAAHRDRLFALAGDGAVYFTKDQVSGKAAAFSDADGFFLDFDVADGPFTGIASDGTTLFVSKRSRIYLVTGDGPSLDGNNTYGFPQPLPSEVGFVSPRGFVGTPDGIIFKSAKGFHLLDRGGGIQIVPAPDAYDSLTVNGGVVLDDRTLAYFVTAEGRTLAWDWALKQWYTTSSGRQPAVAVARWQNQCVYLKTDGTVVKEVTTSFADDGASYTWKVDLVWLNLNRARIYRALIIAEAAAACTLSVSSAYDYDDTTLSTPKTLALTTSSKPPFIYAPDRQWAQSIHLHIEETGTTEGLRLSEIDLEVGLKQGAAKYGAGKYLG